MTYLDLFGTYKKSFTVQTMTCQTLADGRQVRTWADIAIGEGPLVPVSTSLIRYEEGAGIDVTNVLYVDNVSPARVVAVGNRVVAAGDSYDVVRVRDYGTHKEVELSAIL